MRKSDIPEKVRITDQFRQGKAMVYDLKCESVRITISMSSSLEADQVWNADVLTKELSAPPMVRGTGPSRGEAFDVLASIWQSRGGIEGFPSLDWGAIRAALTLVRAI